MIEHTHQRRPTDTIDPLVPIMPRPRQRADGGTRTAPSTGPRVATRPPRTEYATPDTRDVEEILPGVADLSPDTRG